MLLASEVQDTWTEMIDANGLSLFEIMKGMSVNQSLGSYSSGAGFVRIRNRQSVNFRVRLHKRFCHSIWKIFKRFFI